MEPLYRHEPTANRTQALEKPHCEAWQGQPLLNLHKSDFDN